MTTEPSTTEGEREKRIHRNESTEVGRRVWAAVDRAAKRAPRKVLERLLSKYTHETDDGQEWCGACGSGKPLPSHDEDCPFALLAQPQEQPTAPSKKWSPAALEEWTPEQWAGALDAARSDLMCAEDFEPDDVAHVMNICAQVLRRPREPEKRFPILGAGGSVTIPWSVAERAYLDYSKRYGSEQSLKRLAERGGLSEGELDKHLPGWRDLVWPQEQGEPIGYIEEDDIGHPRGYVHLTPNPSRVAVFCESRASRR